jgi:hypothetical protein
VLLHATRLGKQQHMAMLQLLKACNMLWWKSYHSTACLLEVQKLVVEAVCAVQAYLPASELDIKLHDMLHLVEKIRMTGPLMMTSMFPYETLNGGLIRRATNKANPEATMMRSNVLYEVGSFAEDALLKEDEYSARTTHLSKAMQYDFETLTIPNPSATSFAELDVSVWTSGSRPQHKRLKGTQLENIHRYFMIQDEQYARLFNERFMPELREEYRSRGEVPKSFSYNAKDGSWTWSSRTTFTEEILPLWNHWRPKDLATGSHSDHVKLLCEGLKVYPKASFHTRIQVDSVEFRPASKCINSPYYSWFVALHASGHNGAAALDFNAPNHPDAKATIFAGRIKHILGVRQPTAGMPVEGEDPGDADGLVVDVDWHPSLPGSRGIDKVMNMPVIVKEALKPTAPCLKDTSYMIWDAFAITPTRYAVVPHYSNDRAMVMLTRDPRSLWRAGHPLSDAQLYGPLVTAPRARPRPPPAATSVGMKRGVVRGAGDDERAGRGKRQR